MPPYVLDCVVYDTSEGAFVMCFLLSVSAVFRSRAQLSIYLALRNRCLPFIVFPPGLAFLPGTGVFSGRPVLYSLFPVARCQFMVAWVFSFRGSEVTPDFFPLFSPTMFLFSRGVEH